MNRNSLPPPPSMTRRLRTVVVSVALALPLALLMPSPLLADSSVSRDDALGAVKSFFDGDLACEQAEAFVALYRGESSESDAVCDDEPLALVMSLDMEELPDPVPSPAPPVHQDPPDSRSASLKQVPPLNSDPPDERAAATRQAQSSGAGSDPPKPSKFISFQQEDFRTETYDYAGYGTQGDDYAQSFTTGPHKYGYKVNTVSITFCFGTVPTAGGFRDCPARPKDKDKVDPPYTVSLWTAKMSDDTSLNTNINNNFKKRRYFVPDTKQVVLDKPGQLVAGINQFTVPDGGINVEPGTIYVVVIDFTPTSRSSEPKLLFRTGPGAPPNHGEPSTTDPSGSGWAVNIDRNKSANPATSTGCVNERNKQINCNDPDVLPIYRIRHQDRLNVLLRWDSEAEVWKPFGPGTSPATYRALSFSVSGSKIGGLLLSNLGYLYRDHDNHDYRGSQNDYAQVGQLDPRGCGGTRMPGLSSDELFAGKTWYCNTRTGTWVPGRWMRPCDIDNPTRPADVSICGGSYTTYD